jgi:radical SAM protein with 4Fe4S-binding SPASM domain
MLYRQKFDTFIRIYDDGSPSERIGYIMTKYNFNDRATDASGAVFLEALSRQPQTIDELCIKIAKSFVGIDMPVLKRDAIDFYHTLEQDDFIVSGETPEELDSKDKGFSYKALEPNTIKTDFTPVTRRANASTQDYLEEHFKGKPHLTAMEIELTSRCNERCVHCYIPHENKLHCIEDNLFYSALDQCGEMGVLSMALTGGEPMCHPHFIDYLRKIREYDFAVAILSNLTLLNDAIIDVMKGMRSISIQVSLYSMKPEVHDSITQLPGSFYKTKDAILRLIENDIPLRISCPTMKQNKNDYIEVLEWAHEHKVKATTDYIMMARYDHTTGNLDNRLSLKEVGEIIGAIIENDGDYQKEILKPGFSEQENRDRSNDIVCSVCVDAICMVANGNVYPCAGWQDYICGNLKETTLREVWENSPRVQYLRNLRKKNFPKCLDCEDRGFCAMCMVRNANENNEISAVGTLGNPLKINEHFCKVAALNRKIVLEWKAKAVQ